jgi:hypothetical protein
MKVRMPGVILLLLAVVGCSSSPQDEVRQLEKATSFELYSLEPMADPDTHEPDYDPNGPGERLHGWRILGKTAVRDEPTRRKLIDALKEGMERDGVGAKCFDPRHAIRRMAGGQPVDLLICFECGNVALFRGETRVGGYPNVARSVQSVFDEVLKEAGVPLAKKPKRR